MRKIVNLLRFGKIQCSGRIYRLEKDYKLYGFELVDPYFYSEL